jgi:hypothetical protein
MNIKVFWDVTHSLVDGYLSATQDAIIPNQSKDMQFL